jgi:LruC domain-containing protein
MKKRIYLLTLMTSLFVVGLFATTTTRYVSLTGNNTLQYTTLANGANNIASAISVSSPGDIILVDDGTYVLSSTIIVNIGITIKSINGSAAVIVDGNNAVKCFLISNSNAVLDGFTVQNAHNSANQYGGGINITSGGTVKNCTLKNNYAIDGGGVALDNGGLVENCYIFDNSGKYGGGVRLLNNGEVRNCVIKGNSASLMGGGVNIWNGGKVKNCVITDNTAPSGNGAGIRTRKNGKVYNCIIYYNNGENYAVSSSGYYYKNCCTTPALPTSYSSNCISSIPMFTATTSGAEDYRLLAGSPCIDTGINFVWMNTVADLDGNTRIENGIVDMGPYEYSTPVPNDTDGDGVADINDDYPADPDRAFNNYYPPGGNGTLAYEDLWPGQGDYDFNDLVIDYRFMTVTSGSNHIVETFGTFIVKAFGASLENGFGFQFANNNIANTDITSVTGHDLQEGYINLEANGIEEGQSKPTIIVYDNAFNILAPSGSGIGVNTTPSSPYVEPDTLNMFIAYTQGTYTLAQLDIPNFNPFIIVDLNRSIEVHLPDYEPTDKADQSLFSTINDDSNPSTGKYYKTVNNLPWAIHITEPFEYPIEKADITSVYLKFIEWAESGGQFYQDWYRDEPGYRNSSLIYTHN